MRNQRGVAMLMALVTMTVLAILTAELVYQVGVYQRLVYNQVDDLRAQHLAQSALRIARLQLTAVSKAKGKLKNLGAQNMDALVNRIWQTPIVLPPPTPKGLGPSATEALKKFESSLALNGRISVQIFGESDRVNLNQLVWLPDSKQSSKDVKGGTQIGGEQETTEQRQQAVRDRFKTLIDNILTKKKFDDNLFRERYASLRPEEVVLNLEAWLSPQVAVSNEEDIYTLGIEEPFGIKNAPMQSLSELHMVKGFDDTLVNLFSNYFTTSITEGININKVSGELLHSLLPELDDRTLNSVLTRRNDPNLGPFASTDDFWKYLNTQGEFNDLKDKVQQRGVVFVTTETSYRVVVTAESGNAHKTWLANFGLQPPSTQTNSQSQNPNFDISKPLSEQTSGSQKQNQNDNKIPSILYLKTDG